MSEFTAAIRDLEERRVRDQPGRCRRLRAAVIDMSASYEPEARRHCPNAAIVFDLFQVVAKCAGMGSETPKAAVTGDTVGLG